MLPRCKYNLTLSAGVVTLHIQVDRMFRAEAEITTKQYIQDQRGDIYTMKGYSALTYNCLKTVTCKHSFNSSAINDGKMEARKRETADVQMETGDKR